MSLTLEEQETIINYDASSIWSDVYTIYPPVYRKLDKLCEEYPEQYKLEKIDRWGGHHYIIDKRMIRFGKPASEKRKEASRLNAMKHGFGSMSTPDETSSTVEDEEMDG